jgi:integrase
MGTLNDPDGHAAKWEREKDKLDDHEPEADAEAFQGWTPKLDTKEPLTAYWQLNKCIILSKSADRPLTDFESADGVLTLIQREAGDYSKGVTRQYRQAARLFYEHMGREWHDDIHVGAPPGRHSEIQRSKLFTREECDALLAACDNSRDRALLMTLLATGQRIGALLTLKLGDVEFEGERNEKGTIYLNEDALGLKDAEGVRPLTFATEAVRAWIRDHPPADDDAPLFCTLKGGHGGNRADGSYYEYERGDPMSRQQATRRFRKIAKRTAENDDTVTVDSTKSAKFHNYRHTTATRLDQDPNVSESHANWILGWSKDSGQMDRYSHATDSEMMATFRQAHGINDDSGTVVIGQPTFESCPHCSANVDPTEGSCEGCGYQFLAAETATNDERSTVFECITCSRSISPDDDFCRHCGANQNDPDTSTDAGSGFDMIDRDTATEAMLGIVDQTLGKVPETAEKSEHNVDGDVLQDIAWQAFAETVESGADEFSPIKTSEPVDTDE